MLIIAKALKNMRVNRYMAILACCLSLVACGSGGGTATPAAGAVAAPAATPAVPAVPATPATNSAPTASAVAVTDSNGGRVVVGDTLVGSYTYADAEGDIEGVSSFRWLRNGTVIANATAKTYKLTAADSGKIITFEVTPVAATGTLIGAAATSAAIIAVNKTTTASIVPSRTACTAPCGVMFDATGSTSLASTQPFFELDYKWDYGDAGATFQQRPSINANKSGSAIGAHVYDKAGTYTATLTVTDKKGQSGSKQVVINVADPNVTYAGNTYCVSKTNNFTSCPTQAFHLTSFSAASAVMTGPMNTNTIPARILFRSGETFITHGQNTTIRNGPLLISSYGTGAKPILIDQTFVGTGVPLFTVLTSDSVAFVGLHFSGAYNPATGLGVANWGLFFYTSDTNSLVYRNSFSGLSNNIDIRDTVASNSTVKPKFNMVVDNKISDWQAIGVFGSFGNLSAILGNTIKQNTLAQSKPCGNCKFPAEGPIRLENPSSVLIQYNDMFNNAGWSSAGLAHQPNIRLGTNGKITKSVVADNILEGGFGVMEMIPANPTLRSVQGEVIIERNKFTATSNSQTFIDTALGGSVIRNNLFLKPNNGHALIGTGSFNAAINYSGVRYSGISPLEGPINLTLVNQVYNNTLISLATTSAPVLKLVNVRSSFSFFEIHNNLVYAPLVVGGGEAGLLGWKYGASLANVHTSNNLIYTPNNTNFVWNNGISETLSTWQTTGNGTSSLLTNPLLTNPAAFDATLQATSPAIDAGRNINGLMSDFNDKLRTAIPDIGALEF